MKNYIPIIRKVHFVKNALLKGGSISLKAIMSPTSEVRFRHVYTFSNNVLTMG